MRGSIQDTALSRRFSCVLGLWLLQAAALPAAEVIGHRLTLQLDPPAGTLEVRDTLTLPAGAKRWLFDLHAGLAPREVGGAAQLASLGRSAHLERFVLTRRDPNSGVTLAYAGRIRHDLEEVAESPGRSHLQSSGAIRPQGVFLDGASGWYPRVLDSLQRFDLEVGLPTGWRAVSQGAGPDLPQDAASAAATGVRVRWREDQPQDDIYLVAAPFYLYRRRTPVAEAQVYLREDDPGLAQRYLSATREYLDLYSRLLGRYAYPKFALVENTWESGYGMPSFTLLGPQVIRLPFIVHTSYPHEILHNWWGNGVYVDYDSGNWSEGLTTYLADHLLQERQGRGAAYRRDTLQQYADSVRAGQDFPLRAFHARHGNASQSVGYGKGLMLFHMLRRELGERAFIDALRRFYQDYRFRPASWGDLQHTCEEIAGRDLTGFFEQWLTRTGAPRLAISDVQVRPDGMAYRVTGRLHQTQAGAPFNLQVPLLVYRQEGEPSESRIPLPSRTARFELKLAWRPLRLDLDPRFDLFRLLYPQEAPPALSALFGADQGLILLPTAAAPDLLAAYRRLAEQWSRGYHGWAVGEDAGIAELPRDRPVWILGWENRFRDAVARRLGRFGAVLSGQGAHIAGRDLPAQRDSVVLVTRVPDAGAPHQGTQVLGFLGASDPGVLPGLARKLPHYGKYGALAFRGARPDNVLKIQWPVTDSPLSVVLAAGAEMLPVPAGPVLIDGLE